MNKTSHIITESERTYGIISMRTKDGTRDFFDDLPPRFSIIFKGQELKNCQIAAKKVWIGFELMRSLAPGVAIQLKKNSGVVFIT